MSVLLQFAMFPTDKGISASPWVSKIIEMVRGSGFEYRLTSMATIVETSTLAEAQEIVEKAYSLLEPECERVYCTISLDIRKGPIGRLEGKIDSIEQKIGPVKR
ncbi:MAG: thiamine-binding protein [Bacteroidales bacterium]|nr:thiamine-binding protein [Bacteroidales bacterium]